MLRNDSPFVFGNKKLPKTTAVLNICPAHLCPSRILGLCQLRDPNKECYALREERMYPNCIPSRMKMQEYWDRNDAAKIVRDLAALNFTKKIAADTIRINECGDFRHQADLEKAEMIAYYAERIGIGCYCYTARKDLDFSEVQHLVVNGSGFKAHNEFRISYDKDGKYPLECPGNCRKCNMCTRKGGYTIVVKKH